MLKSIIRVLIVDDSPVMCKVIANILNADSQILVAGIAHNGKEAVELVPTLKPDLITMDIHMPVMDGFEATKQIMAYNPTPILVLSTSVFKAGMDKVFRAISYGALDVVEKGDLEITEAGDGGKKLIEKIKFLSNIEVLHHPLAKIEERRKKATKVLKVSKRTDLSKIVAIASSTGGPQALLEILREFPKSFPCGIVIVQHITSGFAEGLAEWLNGECQINVKLAKNSDEVLPGTAYVAPCDLQMRIKEGGRIYLSEEAAFEGHCPSGDILLESVAKIYKDNAIGIILTGMGKDGAMGIKSIQKACGQTIAQDQESCIVFGMPKAAIEMGGVDKIVPLTNISKEIVTILEKKNAE